MKYQLKAELTMEAWGLFSALLETSEVHLEGFCRAMMKGILKNSYTFRQDLHCEFTLEKTLNSTPIGPEGWAESVSENIAERFNSSQFKKLVMIHKFIVLGDDGLIIEYVWNNKQFIQV